MTANIDVTLGNVGDIDCFGAVPVQWAGIPMHQEQQDPQLELEIQHKHEKFS
jgi:hypothetical protein